MDAAGGGSGSEVSRDQQEQESGVHVLAFMVLNVVSGKKDPCRGKDLQTERPDQWTRT